jgi:hypothetical protein
MVTVLVTACVGGYVVTTTPTIATLEGRLTSGVVDFVGKPFECTWIVDRNGKKFDLVVDGHDSRYDPLRLIDSGGRVAAREGDWLRVRYNADAIGDSICSPGVFIVAESFDLLASPDRS